MSAQALLVAAHGHGDGSSTNQLVAELAQQAAALAGIPEWGLAFQQGTPRFEDALACLPGRSTVVVPLLTSEGYYLDKLKRSLRGMFQLSEPVGTSPWLPDLVALRVRTIANRFQLRLEQTSLLVVGHGTRRNPKSRLATEQLVQALRDGPLREVRAAFLDEEPEVEQAAAELLGPNRIIFPFLIGPGDHSSADLPRRLATPLGWHQRTYLDEPLARDPALAELIAERACGRVPGFAPKGGQNRWSFS